MGAACGTAAGANGGGRPVGAAQVPVDPGPPGPSHSGKMRKCTHRMHDVYILGSRQDSDAHRQATRVAENLVKSLDGKRPGGGNASASAANVFYAPWCTSKLTGAAKQAAQLEALKKSSLVVLVVDTHTLQSFSEAATTADDLLSLWEAALELHEEGRVLLVPVFVGPVRFGEDLYPYEPSQESGKVIRKTIKAAFSVHGFHVLTAEALDAASCVKILKLLGSKAERLARAAAAGESTPERRWECDAHKTRAHDVYLSHRNEPDRANAVQLYAALNSATRPDTGRPLSAYLGSICTNVGEDWELGWGVAQQNASLVLLIVSHDMLRDLIDRSPPREFDHVLTEFENALERRRAGRCLVLPVFWGSDIGDLWRAVPDLPHPSTNRNIRATIKEVFDLFGCRLSTAPTPDEMQSLVATVLKMLGSRDERLARATAPLDNWKCDAHSLNAHDVYFSYRVATERAVVHRLYPLLSEKKLDATDKKLSCYVDARCQVPGEPWAKSWLAAQATFKSMLLFISAPALRTMADQAPSREDNLLVEWERALARRTAGKAVLLPVFVGGGIDFDPESYPEAPHFGTRADIRATIREIFELPHRETLSSEPTAAELAALATKVLNKVCPQGSSSVSLHHRPSITNTMTWRCYNHQDAKHDCFLSYRVWSESELVSKVYEGLTNRGLRVFQDQKCLNKGEAWETALKPALSGSKLVIVFISEAALRGFEKAHEAQDNFLVELENAIDWQRRGEMLVLPVFVGSVDFKALDRFSPLPHLTHDLVNYRDGLGELSKNAGMLERGVRGTVKAVLDLNGVLLKSTGDLSPVFDTAKQVLKDGDAMLSKAKDEYGAIVLQQIRSSLSQKEVLGLGATAVVYKGRVDGQDVAVKALADTGNVERTAQFDKEARILLSIQNPHVMSCLHYVPSGLDRYLIMPLADCGSLAEPKPVAVELLKSGVNLLKLAIGAAEGLSFLHAKNIIHRDIKPANMLLSIDPPSEGQSLPTLGVYIADFGIAHVDGTSVGTNNGTLGYQAPEAKDGLSSRKSDVWSLGVVLLQLVRGGPAAWMTGEGHAMKPRLLSDEATKDTRPAGVQADKGVTWESSDQLDGLLRLAKDCVHVDRLMRPSMVEVKLALADLLSRGGGASEFYRHRDLLTSTVGRRCTLCEEEPRTVLFLPCSHALCCDSCTDKIKAEAKGGGQAMCCPLCRAEVENMVPARQPVLRTLQAD